jgi:predicted metal-binding membrane protein
MTAAGDFPRRRVPPVIAWTIGVAWALSIAAHTTGKAEALHHHGLIEGGLPLWSALGLFLVAWQVMLAAMMLPSSLPLIGLFFRAASSQPAERLVKAAFLAGYAAVWTTFGTMAFLSDAALHRLVHQWTWLADREWLVGGGVLLLAGAFQFSRLKDKCLEECRHPGAYMLKHYRRGARAAFRMGQGHGLFCLGCCWALMLVSFAVGVANLVWMAMLTALMVFEKTGARGRHGVAPIGTFLIGLGVLVLAHPAWLSPYVFG